MFKKKPSLKPAATVRSSDRRKLANELIAALSPPSLPAAAPPPPPSSSDDAAAAASSEAALRNSLLPESTQAAKFTTTAGPDLSPIHGTVYLGTHPDSPSTHPLWVRVDDDGEFFPTVYTLWQNPGLLPVLHTHPPVIEKLRGGADLMVPGLIGPPFPEGATRGRLVAVASSEKPSVPLVVGVCEVDIARLERAVGEHGKAVRVLHWVGDELYKYGGGGGKVPDALPEAGEAAVEQAAEGVEALHIEEGSAEQGGEAQDTGVEEIRDLDTKEIDSAFLSATLYGLHQHSQTPSTTTPLSFPLSSSTFISTLVLPFLPPPSNFPPHNLLQNTAPHPSLQLKKSSWKSAAKFLKHLEKAGLVKTKTRGGGEIVVLDVNWAAESVLEFVPYKLPVAREERNSATVPGTDVAGADTAVAGPVQIVELFRPHGRVLKFFEEVKAGTKDYYTASELKQLLNTYIDTAALSNPKNKRLVKLDPLLSNALFSTNAADSAALSLPHQKRDDLATRLVSSCLPYHKLLTTTPASTPSNNGTSSESKPRAGPPPRVNVTVEKRQGKKTMTRITGVEAFGVNAKELAEALQRVCAGSATTGQAVGCKVGVVEVMVQGSQVKVVERELEKRGVPRKFLVVVDKTGGKK